MKIERLIKGGIALAATIGCYFIITSVTYDSDDVYSQKNAADVIGPFLMIGIATGIYAIVQFVKLVRGT